MRLERILCLLLLSAECLSGCATAPRGRGWGRDATPVPGWRRVGRAAQRAALAPETWIPMAGALALQIRDGDERLSDWAVRHAPVFGSQKNARRASRSLLDATTVAYGVTALATPSGPEPGDWVVEKAKGLAIGVVATGATAGTVSALKRTARRTRPDGSNRLSFPSGHASSAAVRATLASRNLECVTLSPGIRAALQGSVSALAAGCAWSRVEGNLHYPSDVLVGAALGHFFGAFFNDAFLGVEGPSEGELTIEVSRRGAAVGVRWTF